MSEASIPDLPEAIWERLLQSDASASTNGAVACTCHLLRMLIARVQLPSAGALVAICRLLENGSGTWRDTLYSAALARGRQEAAARPHSAYTVQAQSSVNAEQIEFSAFFPQRAELNTAVVLVTDGVRLVLLDSCLRLHRGLIPPHSASMNRPRLWQVGPGWLQSSRTRGRRLLHTSQGILKGGCRHHKSTCVWESNAGKG